MKMKDKEKITIKHLFEVILEVPINKSVTCAINDLKTEGFSETGIVFGIMKSIDKVIKFKDDSRFVGIIKNEVRKNSFKTNDPRWNDKKKGVK